MRLSLRWNKYCTAPHHNRGSRTCLAFALPAPPPPPATMLSVTEKGRDSLRVQYFFHPGRGCSRMMFPGRAPFRTTTLIWGDRGGAEERTMARAFPKYRWCPTRAIFIPSTIPPNNQQYSMTTQTENSEHCKLKNASTTLFVEKTTTHEH